MCWPIRHSRASTWFHAAIFSSICAPRRRRRLSRFSISRLREGGILLLGNSENPGNIDGRFEVISKSHRLYRRIGRSQTAALGFAIEHCRWRTPIRARLNQARRLRARALSPISAGDVVLENFAPAAVLINRKHECLYSMGPTDRYLQRGAGARHSRFARHDAVRACASSSDRQSNGPVSRTRALSPPAARQIATAMRSVQHRRATDPERRRGTAADLLYR